MIFRERESSYMANYKGILKIKPFSYFLSF